MGKARHQAHPARAIQRRSRAIMMIGTANLLDNITDSNFREILRDHDDYLHYDEYKYIKRARKLLRWSSKALRVIARRLENE